MGITEPVVKVKGQGHDPTNDEAYITAVRRRGSLIVFKCFIIL